LTLDEQGETLQAKAWESTGGFGFSTGLAGTGDVPFVFGSVYGSVLSPRLQASGYIHGFIFGPEVIGALLSSGFE
jgi:hypothetical protein